jgi:peptide/nickel transport system ATP-binding protein
MTILRTEQLQTFYQLDMSGQKKEVKAVNGIDLDIQENEVYGIAGESGCGKSTLLKSLFASITPPLRHIGGKIFYRIKDADVDALALSPEEIRRLRWEYISYVPQGSMSVLNPVLKLKETYRDFLESHVARHSRHEAFAIAKEHINKLGLPQKILDAYPHQLSGGMRQRVTIALAAVLKPKIIIADEPTTALDVVVQRGVVQLLKEIQNELRNTIILVTHDMGVHANIADRIGIMYAGKIVEEASTTTIFSAPRHPYTRFLINSLPQFGDKSVRQSVPGSPPSLDKLPPGCSFHPRCPMAEAVCMSDVPETRELQPGHRVACWLAK